MLPFDIFNPAFGNITLTIPDAFITLKPLVIFLVGIIIFGIFIFKFYQFLAQKDIFELNLQQYNRAKHASIEKLLGIILYIIEYLLLLPVFIFFWFIVLAALITLLSKGHTAESVLLTSVALVGAVRATAYYNEELSKDLAKLLPFVFLGVLLIDLSAFSLEQSLDTLKQIPTLLNTLIYYFIFVFGLELVLRIGSTIKDVLKSLEE